MSKTEILQKSFASPGFDLLRNMPTVKREYGRSFFAQGAEMLRLALSAGRLSPKDYYYYRLFDSKRFSAAEKRAFVGHSAQIVMNQICNDPRWRAIGEDKLVYTAAMQAQGFPVPKILALCHPTRSYGAAVNLHSAEEIASYLRNGAEAPFFCKPVNGMFSHGVARVDDIDCAEDEVVLAGGRSVPLQDFAAEASGFSDGYLFQELLRPHEELERICGNRVGTIRVMVLLWPTGPEIIRAIWKIPTGENIADNLWREGNVFAAVDIDSGRIEKAGHGAGLNHVSVDSHPDSGQPIVGFTLPQWSRAKQLCLEAATGFPGIRIQAWDIALCREGPVLVELNIGGGYRIPQQATELGLLDDQFRKFLDELSPNWRTRVAFGVLNRLPSAVRYWLS